MPVPATADELNRITSLVIASAIDVHRTLGPGLLESAYLPCLCYELHQHGLHFEAQKPLPLVYRTVTLACAYRTDLVVESQVIVEVKALATVPPIVPQQLLTYLKLADCRVGLILNFGAHSMKAGIERVVNQFPHR